MCIFNIVCYIKNFIDELDKLFYNGWIFSFNKSCFVNLKIILLYNKLKYKNFFICND